MPIPALKKNVPKAIAAELKVKNEGYNSIASFKQLQAEL
jgi:hypothetical protein